MFAMLRISYFTKTRKTQKKYHLTNRERFKKISIYGPIYLPATHGKHLAKEIQTRLATIQNENNINPSESFVS